MNQQTLIANMIYARHIRFFRWVYRRVVYRHGQHGQENSPIMQEIRRNLG